MITSKEIMSERGSALSRSGYEVEAIMKKGVGRAWLVITSGQTQAYGSGPEARRDLKRFTGVTRWTEETAGTEYWGWKRGNNDA